MQLSVVLILTVATLASPSEASWLGNIWHSVTHWVGEHCSLNVGFPVLVNAGCHIGKRSLETNDNYVEFLEQACQEVRDPRIVPGGDITLQLVTEVFAEVDYMGDRDGTLNRTEFVHFLKAMEIFHYCMKKSHFTEETPMIPA